MRRKGEFLTFDFLTFNILARFVVGFFGLVTLLPFLLLLLNSLSSEHAVIMHGFSFVPQEFSLAAYRMIFNQPIKVINAYAISIFVTTVGTATSLFFSSMAAFVLNRKNVRYRNAIAFFIYFTTLFSGGLVPYYFLIVSYLKLKNTIAVLILTQLFSVFYILILRNFITHTIPESLVESAKIDGASDFRIFLTIVLPLIKPALASIGLFISLGYWNDWWSAMMFNEKENLQPLQFMLYKMFWNISVLGQITGVGYTNPPRETFKLAMTVVATGPVFLLYPFVQKYFVKGIILGAVKE